MLFKWVWFYVSDTPCPDYCFFLFFLVEFLKRYKNKFSEVELFTVITSGWLAAFYSLCTEIIIIKRKSFYLAKKHLWLCFCVFVCLQLFIWGFIWTCFPHERLPIFIFSCTSLYLVFCVRGTFEAFPFLFISLDFLWLPASLPLPFPKSQEALFSSDPSDPSTFPDRILQFECCHFPFHHFVPSSSSAPWPAHLLWNGIWPFLSALFTDFLLTTLSLPAPPVAESLPVSRV